MLLPLLLRPHRLITRAQTSKMEVKLVVLGCGAACRLRSVGPQTLTLCGVGWGWGWGEDAQSFPFPLFTTQLP